MNDSEALALVRFWARRSMKLRDEQGALSKAVQQAPGSPFAHIKLAAEPGFAIKIADPTLEWIVVVEQWVGDRMATFLGTGDRLGEAVEAALPDAVRVLGEFEQRVDYLRQLAKIRPTGEK